MAAEFDPNVASIDELITRLIDKLHSDIDKNCENDPTHAPWETDNDGAGWIANEFGHYVRLYGDVDPQANIKQYMLDGLSVVDIIKKLKGLPFNFVYGLYDYIHHPEKYDSDDDSDAGSDESDEDGDDTEDDSDGDGDEEQNHGEQKLAEENKRIDEVVEKAREGQPMDDNDSFVRFYNFRQSVNQ